MGESISKGVDLLVTLRTYRRRRRGESGIRGKLVYREGENPELG